MGIIVSILLTLPSQTCVVIVRALFICKDSSSLSMLIHRWTKLLTLSAGMWVLYVSYVHDDDDTVIMKK